MDVKIKNVYMVFVLFLFTCMFIFVGCKKINSNQNSEKKEMVEKMNVEIFKTIKYGDSYGELKKQIGEPSCYGENVKKYPVYILEDGGKAKIICFDDKILKIIVENSEGEIIYSLDKFAGMADMKYEERWDYFADCEGTLDVEAFDELDWDYDYNDILLTLGDPTIIDGSGMPRYLYKLKDGTSVNVAPASGYIGIEAIIHIDKDNKIISARYR